MNNKLKIIINILIIFICWEIISYSFNLTNLISSPTLILKSFIQNINLLSINLYQTLLIALISLIISVFFSYILAIIIDNYHLTLILKILEILQMIPPIILIPIIVMIFGFNVFIIILINIILISFPLIILIYKSFQTINEEQLILFNLLHQSKYHLYYYLKIPHSIKALHQGLLITITYCISNTICSEYLTGQQGLGVILKNATSTFNIDLSICICLIVIIITLLLLKGLKLIIKRSKYEY